MLLNVNQGHVRKSLKQMLLLSLLLWRKNSAMFTFNMILMKDLAENQDWLSEVRVGWFVLNFTLSTYSVKSH